MSTDEPDAKASKVHPERHLAYMRPDATMTLREGLDEYYASIPDLIPTDGESEKDHLFLFHDTCHVLFGCDTVQVPR